jgi:hypothetical protein
VDLTFVLDVSTSVEHTALCGKLGMFERMRSFTTDVVQSLAESGQLHAAGVRVGVVTFANNGQVVSALEDNGVDGANVLADISKIEYAGAGGRFTDSNLHLGLGAARGELANSNTADASQRSNVIVLLSDGLARNSEGANGTAQVLAELDDGAKFYNAADEWAYYTGKCPDVDLMRTVAPLDDHVGRLFKPNKDAAIDPASKLIAGIISNPTYMEWCSGEGGGAEEESTTHAATTTELGTTEAVCTAPNCAECVAGTTGTCARCTNSQYLTLGFCLPDCKQVRGFPQEFGEGVEGRECIKA